MDADNAQCSKCRQSLGQARSWQRCESGHALCDSCTPHLFLMELTNCSLCQRPLMSEEEYGRRHPSLESQAMRAAGRMQLRWSLYLFRSPDLVLVILACAFSLLFLVSAGRSASFLPNVLEWAVGSLLVALGPALALLFVRKKRSGLGMVAGWRAAWGGDRRPVGVILGVAALVFLIHLMMERPPL